MSVLDHGFSDALLTGTIEIRVYELHWFGKKRVRIGAVVFKAHEMADAQSEITGKIS